MIVAEKFNYEQNELPLVSRAVKNLIMSSVSQRAVFIIFKMGGSLRMCLVFISFHQDFMVSMGSDFFQGQTDKGCSIGLTILGKLRILK
jgi:hypothetical protein